MMVLLWKGVECSAKIAMTTLHGGRAAMCLLPIHDPPRLIFLDAREVTDLLILKWAGNLLVPQNATKVIIKASSAMRRISMFVRSDRPEYSSIPTHDDVISELAAPPPGKT
jgi:hypothetical protein